MKQGYAYTESHCQDQKQVIVHLFEWSWDSIARFTILLYLELCNNLCFMVGETFEPAPGLTLPRI